MNRLPNRDRARILHALVEGNSIESVSRQVKCSSNTIDRILKLGGRMAAHFHDDVVSDLRTRRLELDEAWNYIYCKPRNVPYAKAAPSFAGDCWTWLALDADTKFIVSWVVGERGSPGAEALLSDTWSRLGSQRVQISTDGYPTYFDPISFLFHGRVDYGRVLKVFGKTPDGGLPFKPMYSKKEIVLGDPDSAFISTSYVERLNLSFRMGLKRYTRRSNAFSRRIRNHRHATALYVFFHNWAKAHDSLRHLGTDTTPAMAAGLARQPFSMEWLASKLPP